MHNTSWAVVGDRFIFFRDGNKDKKYYDDDGKMKNGSRSCIGGYLFHIRNMNCKQALGREVSFRFMDS